MGGLQELLDETVSWSSSSITDQELDGSGTRETISGKPFFQLAGYVANA